MLDTVAEGGLGGEGVRRVELADCLACDAGMVPGFLVKLEELPEGCGTALPALLSSSADSKLAEKVCTRVSRFGTSVSLELSREASQLAEGGRLGTRSHQAFISRSWLSRRNSRNVFSG